jgi:short subunit dehydrogenase-like uncharacterized protein
MSFLIYGANGYTGKLIVEQAVKNGLKPVIGGRTEAKLKPLAQQYGLEYLVFGLDARDELANQLRRFQLVLNCAGPFSRTARKMVEACLESGTHYLDITGEIEVFELVKSYHKKAAEKNIILMPGVGFDVVPTDCMAKYLHSQLPDATHLELAFMGVGGSISHGTLSTIIENLGKPGAIRENGKIVLQPSGQEGRDIDFGIRKQFAMSIPWGDVSTAFHTTGIPNIKVFTGIPKNNFYMLKLQPLFNPLLKGGLVKKWLQGYVDKNISGPTPAQLEKGRAYVWGKVTNAKGQTIEARLECPETYLLTAKMAVMIVQKILAGKPDGGYHTPAGMFGYQLIEELEGARFLK